VVHLAEARDDAVDDGHGLGSPGIARGIGVNAREPYRSGKEFFERPIVLTWNARNLATQGKIDGKESADDYSAHR